MIATVMVSELLLARRNLLIRGAMVVAMAAAYPFLVLNPGVVLAVAVLMMGIIPAALLARPDKFKADATTCSLPVTRAALVTGRYLLMWTLSAAGLVVFLLVSVATPHGQYPLSSLITADSLINALLGIAVTSALIAPAALRYGFSGLMGMMIGLNVLTVLVFIRTALGLIRGGLTFVFEEIPAAFAALRSTLGSPGYHLSAAAVAALVSWASLLLARRLFQHREL